MALLRARKPVFDATRLKSRQHKVKLQKEIGDYYFPGFDIATQTLDDVDMEKLNLRIRALKTKYYDKFLELFKEVTSGIGPGEFVLYFLIKNSTLGTGSSTGVDLINKSAKYEIKGVRVSKDRFAYDFKLTVSVDTKKIDAALFDLYDTLYPDKGKMPLGANGTITKVIMDDMRERGQGKFETIEKNYAKLMFESYFHKTPIIFINNNVDAPRKKGLIESIKIVQEKDIKIERLEKLKDGRVVVRPKIVL